MPAALNHERRGGSTAFRRSPLKDSLITAVLGADYATPRRVAEVKPHGRPAGKGADELVLEVRRLYEQAGIKPTEIRAHLASLGHELSIDRVRQLISYSTRAHLVPAPGAAPYITKAAP